MDTEILKLFGELAIDGLWIGLGVFVVVQAAKIAKLVKESSVINPQRLALISALFFGLGWMAVEFSGADKITIELVIALVFRWIVGSLSAALFYEVVLKPILTALKVPERFIRAAE